MINIRHIKVSNKDGQLCDPTYQETQGIDGGLIGPVDVFNDQGCSEAAGAAHRAGRP
jgi:hypothetical protein